MSANDYSTAQIDAALKAAWGLDTQLIIDKTYFVVEAQGTIVACGGWSYRATLFGNNAEPSRDESIIDVEHGAAKIRAFFVHPHYARQGLGSLIMACCERNAQEKGYKRLELMATLPGKRLYERHGFAAGAALEYSLGEGLTILFVSMEKTLCIGGSI